MCATDWYAESSNYFRQGQHVEAQEVLTLTRLYGVQGRAIAWSERALFLLNQSSFPAKWRTPIGECLVARDRGRAMEGDEATGHSQAHSDFAVCTTGSQ